MLEDRSGTRGVGLQTSACTRLPNGRASPKRSSRSRPLARRTYALGDSARGSNLTLDTSLGDSGCAIHVAFGDAAHGNGVARGDSARGNVALGDAAWQQCGSMVLGDAACGSSGPLGNSAHSSTGACPTGDPGAYATTCSASWGARLPQPWRNSLMHISSSGSHFAGGTAVSSESKTECILL